MAQDFSWDRSAQQYLELYEQLQQESGNPLIPGRFHKIEQVRRTR